MAAVKDGAAFGARFTINRSRLEQVLNVPEGDANFFGHDRPSALSQLNFGIGLRSVFRQSAGAQGGAHAEKVYRSIVET